MRKIVNIMLACVLCLAPIAITAQGQLIKYGKAIVKPPKINPVKPLPVVSKIPTARVPSATSGKAVLHVRSRLPIGIRSLDSIIEARQKLYGMVRTPVIRPLPVKGPGLPVVFNRDSAKTLAEHYYPKIKSRIERGECDTIPSTLLWASNFALAEGDTLFSEQCFDKAKSPYLNEEALYHVISSGLSRSRDRIPELLQYVAERNFLSLTDSTTCEPDSARKFSTEVMTEWATDYSPALLPIIRIYYCDSLAPPDLNTNLRRALMLYADSTLTYADTTIEPLLNNYIWHSRCLAEYCSDFYADSTVKYMYDCFELCREPRLMPHVERSFDNAMLLADMAGILAAEGNYRHYTDIAAKIDPTKYEEAKPIVLNNIAWYYGNNRDATEQADRIRFRIYTAEHPDPFDAGLDLTCKVYETILNHTTGNHHKFLAKHIMGCAECHRRAYSVIASIDELRKISSDSAQSPHTEMWCDLYDHYFRFVTDPGQTHHIDAVEKILKRVKKTDMPTREEFELETAIALADMKARTDENPRAALKILKPYERKYMKGNSYTADISRYNFHDYMTLLYNLTGDSERSTRHAEIVREMDKYLSAEDI